MCFMVVSSAYFAGGQWFIITVSANKRHTTMYNTMNKTTYFIAIFDIFVTRWQT